MPHQIELSVSLRFGKLPTKRQRASAISEAGGLIFVGTSHIPTAKKLSKLPWVLCVVATSVITQPCGVWRNGKVS